MASAARLACSHVLPCVLHACASSGNAGSGGCMAGMRNDTPAEGKPGAGTSLLPGVTGFWKRMPKFGFFESVTALGCSGSEKGYPARMALAQGIRADTQAAEAAV